MKVRYFCLAFFLMVAGPASAETYILGQPDGSAIGHFFKAQPLKNPLPRAKAMTLGKKWYLDAAVTNPACTATQKKTGPVYGDLDQAKGTITYSCVDKTAQELAAETKAQNEAYIQNASGQKAMWVLIELIDNLLSKGTISASDFSADVKQAYQDLKSKVDAVKP